jgi:flavin reductase (DIM6/NTAB) family NADH-FMN oxidoreductase RutF
VTENPPKHRRYREVVSHFATGVSIVTADGRYGPSGLTANALCSLSLDPLLLLVCLENSARTLPLVQSAGRFAVNILRHEQHALSGVFASKASEREKFRDVRWERRDGVPVLSDALAWLTCELRETHPGGDHTIAIGAVIDMDHDPAGQPLLWYRGRYGVFAHATPAEARLI